MRSEFEEAAHLFDSAYNECRDVVALTKMPDQDKAALVHVVQFREGLVAGQFSYSCQIPSGMSSEEDYAAAIAQALTKHYASGEESPDDRFLFFPNEILLQYQPDTGELKQSIRAAQRKAEPNKKYKPLLLRNAAKKGARKVSDNRAIELALENAKQVAYEKSLEAVQGSAKSSIDGAALEELQKLFKLDKPPRRIEAYDISHNQADFPVGSRVVFIDGKREPSLYRKFNIRDVDGIDDYASLRETLSRRFKRAWLNGAGGPVAENNPWSIPDVIIVDGGIGQLNAAVEAQRIFPIDGSNHITGHSSTLAGAKRSASVVLCSLAKNHEELFVYGSNKPINNSDDSPAMLLLRALRDESHRFALAAHRSRRSIRKSLKY